MTLLGGFRLSVGSRTIQEDAFWLRKAASLLKLLALAPGHRLHRECVIEALWPSLGRRAAANNLRQAIHVARRTLDPDPVAGVRYLDSRGEVLALCPEGQLWVDAKAFEEAARAARHARDSTAYRSALDLYPGELLPADRYEEWAEARRRELKGEFHSLLAELAVLHEERGKYGKAIEALERLLREEPVSEEAHAGMMRAHALSGQRGEALRQYDRLQEELRQEFGAQPDSATRRLRDDIMVGKRPRAARSSSSWVCVPVPRSRAG